MSEPKRKAVSRQKAADDLFLRADREWNRRRFRSAFRLLKLAVEKGDRSAQLNLGYFYDLGIGVRRNRELALRWYTRAYRRGDSGAANNIGTIYRDEKHTAKALKWFDRAVKLGDDDANLEIAKI